MSKFSCTASSQYPDDVYKCDMALDGKKNTAWASHGQGAGALIIFVTPGKKKVLIGKIQLFNRASRKCYRCIYF